MADEQKLPIPTSHAEILLRGEVMRLFSHIEKSLSVIVLFCQNDVVAETQKDEAIKFKGMMLHQKIERAIELLKKYHPKVWEKNKQLFEDLICLKKFRNRIAHCPISWDEKDPEFFTIWDIDTAEDNIQYHKGFKYTVTECKRLLDEIESASNKLTEILPDILSKYKELMRIILAGRTNK